MSVAFVNVSIEVFFMGLERAVAVNLFCNMWRFVLRPLPYGQEVSKRPLHRTNFTFFGLITTDNTTHNDRSTAHHLYGCQSSQHTSRHSLGDESGAGRASYLAARLRSEVPRRMCYLRCGVGGRAAVRQRDAHLEARAAARSWAHRFLDSFGPCIKFLLRVAANHQCNYGYWLRRIQHGAWSSSTNLPRNLCCAPRSLVESRDKC